MASIQKIARGYRAQIYVNGRRESKTFITRREAVEWAQRREVALKSESVTPAGKRHTLRDALHKYAEEVSPSKRGSRWELIRLSALEHENLPLDTPISEIVSADIGAFRDDRLRTVSGSTVLREITLLSSVFEAARLDWSWIKSNPCRDIRKPRSNRHRERVITVYEMRAVLKQMGYSRYGPITSVTQSIAVCFLMALRTGMRAGELCSLRWADVHDTHVHLPMTKSGKSRDVPLSSRALRLLERMKGWDDVYVFGVKAGSLDALFRKNRERAGLSGFTWHDTRHTAATMLAKKIDVLDLCKMFGWGDPRFALVYYNPHASRIAALLG